MSHRIITSLLTLGLLGASTFTTVAHADGSTDSTLKQAIVTKASILSSLENGNSQDAEAGYLQWATAWQTENPELLASIERQLLQKQYVDGSKDAFLALIQTGDVQAMDTFSTMLRDNTLSELTPNQVTDAIRAFATYRNGTDYEALKGMLKSKDASFVNAAAKIIGDMQQTEKIPELLQISAESNLQGSIAITRAIVAMGAANEMVARYELQTDLPLPGIHERAALLLAVSGNTTEWDTVKKMLDDKNSRYYLPALSALGNVDTDEAREYVRKGLNGNEQEVLAALQSIDTLSQQDAETELTRIIESDAMSINTRVVAMQALEDMSSASSLGYLRNMTLSSDVPAELRATAILAAQRHGLLADDGFRGSIRVLLAGDDAKVKTAARAALLAYSNNL